MTQTFTWPAVCIGWHDADTGHFTVSTRGRSKDVGWDITLTGKATIVVNARLFGCNAAELATDAGKAALVYIEHLCPVGTAVILTSHGWDKYQGRSDCSITLPDGRDLVTVLIAAGQAAPWDGLGAKPLPTTGATP